MNRIEEIAATDENVLLSPEGELILLDFYKIKAQVEETEKLLKEKLKSAALKRSETFTRIEGKHLSVRYQFTGAKYKLDEGHIEKLPPYLYKKQEKISPISAAIDAYLEQNGSLPEGVNAFPRKKTVVVTIKKGVKEDELQTKKI